MLKQYIKLICKFFKYNTLYRLNIKNNINNI